MSPLERDDFVDAVRACAEALGRTPSLSEFVQHSGISKSRAQRVFNNWNEATAAAGLEPNRSNQKLSETDLFADWGSLVRAKRQIPTRRQYREEGKYSPGVFENRFGPWSAIPAKFLEFAKDKPEWADILLLIPSQKVMTYPVRKITLHREPRSILVNVTPNCLTDLLTETP